jgi:hypothetical protein
MADQFSGIPRQSHKYGLRDILRPLFISNHAPDGGIDEIDVSPDQFGKRRLGSVFAVIPQ